jgi:hypothetical protein
MTTATFDTIESLETLPIKIEYVGATVRDNDWKCDQWRVTISSGAGMHSFDYYTGLGLRTKPRASWGTSKPKAPNIADVLHSLIIDASAADENFNDWCDSCGYLSDSIKALNIYKACLDTARALRKHFSPTVMANIRELLQDY